MISALIVAATLGAQPNLFEPTEMSSETVVAVVTACMVDSTKQGASDRVALAMCGCMTDALRLNTKKGLRPPKNNPTSEQLDRCKAETKRRRDSETSPPPKGKAGS